MKQQDIALIIIAAFIGIVSSFFISNKILVTPQNRSQQVEVVQAISPDLPEPDKDVFNKDANDPTKLITIGRNTNNDPFSAPQQ